ncbi:MAG: hypothetical protein JXA20_04380 [Spirochaetes bacterium]|nr:hypothetical protein [Spirochaetota bacterium]
MNAVIEEYVLVAKRCPCCESLVMARVEREENGETKYDGYRCSRCNWQSPNQKQE